MVKLLDYGLVHVHRSSAEPEPQASVPKAARGGADPLAAGLIAARNLTQAGQILGTPAYMSPEQAGSGQPDARSDVYSVGGVACFALTGRPPYERGSLAELFEAHRSAPVPRLRELLATIPADLEAVILRCLAKAPADRYQSTEELVVALSGVEAGAKWDSIQAKAWWHTQTVIGALKDEAPPRSPSASGPK